MNKLKPYLLLFVGLVPTALCWTDLLSRIDLYIRYGSKPFLNHVSDGYFGVAYLVAAMAATILLWGLVLSIRGKSRSGIAVYSAASLLPLAHMAVLFFMNQQDMLVTYSEFAGNMGP